jgi:hypothetical protein
VKNQNFFLSHFNPERYLKPFFKDSAIQESIKKYGYCILNLLEKDDLGKLQIGFSKISALVEGEFSGDFWPSGRHESAFLRNLAKSEIESVVPKKLETLISLDEVSFIGGTYLVKPPSEKSALNPHQDSSHVNELDFFSVYAWIPLQDVDENNGALKILPESHRLNIKQRSLNVPWILEPYLKLMDEYMVSIPMKAGQVLLFDAALIHSSPVNRSEEFRVAVNYYLHNKKCPFTHFYLDENTPKGKVEMYSVTPEFYYSEEFEKKPDSKYPFLGYQDRHIQSISEKEIKSVLNVISGKKQPSTTSLDYMILALKNLFRVN